MRSSRWIHRQLAWLALCAVVFGAFAPPISKYLATTQGVAWVEVCSIRGAKHVSIDLASKKLPEAPMADDNHCGYCLLQYHSPVFATDPYMWEATTVSTGQLLIGSRDTTVFKRFIRHAHPTRAPPTLS